MNAYIYFLHYFFAVCLSLIGFTSRVYADKTAMPGLDINDTIAHIGQEGYFVESVSFPDSDIAGAHAASLIDAPVDRVAQVVRQVEYFKDIFPQFVESKILSRVGKTSEARLEIEILGGLGKLWVEMRQRERTDPLGLIYFQQRGLAQRGSFDRYQFDIRITPQNGGTQSLFEVWSMVIPNIPLVPQSILEQENKKAARIVSRVARFKAMNIAYKPQDL